MTYVVVWLDSADDQLAAAYLTAQELGAAAAVTEAAARLEVRLRTSPTTLGESRSRHQRWAVVRPLAVQFEVHEEERVVIVTDIRHVPRR